jgi:hypothetical protein
MNTPFCERPSSREVVLLLQKIRTRIVDLLQLHGCPSEVVASIIREAVIALLNRWSRIRDPEQWLLDRIERSILRAVNPSFKETRHDTRPPS